MKSKAPISLQSKKITSVAELKTIAAGNDSMAVCAACNRYPCICYAASADMMMPFSGDENGTRPK